MRARREVVLAAGSIGSPQLLQLSGIGPGALLQHARHSRSCTRCPGVGENLHDHLQIRMVYKVTGRTLNERANSLLGKAAMGLEYLLFRTGPLTDAALAARRVREERSRAADARTSSGTCSRLSLDKFGDPLHPFPAITPSVCNLRPTSRGHVRITAPTPPRIPRSG